VSAATLPRPEPTRLRTALRGTLWLAAVAQVVLWGSLLGPGVPPDEIAHASYAAHLADTGRVLPDLTGLRLLAPDGSWSRQPSYLAHPPLPYLLLAQWVPSPREALDRQDLIRRLRLPSAAIGIAGLSVLLAAVWRLRLSWTQELVASLVVLTPPMVTILAASVTDDTSTWIAGGLTLIGAERLAERRADTVTGLLLGSGVGVALLTKLTAALLCGGLAALVIVWWLASSAGRLRRAVPVLALTFLLATPGIAYHLEQLSAHGTLVPRATELQLGAESGTASGGPLQPLSAVAWGAHAVRLLGVTWVNPIAHRLFDRDSAAEVLGLLLVPLLVAAGLLAPPRLPGERVASPAPVLRAAAVTLALVVAVNVAFSYRIHLQIGYMGGIQARYYFPLLPAVGLLAAHGTAAIVPIRWRTSAALSLAALLVLANVTAMVRILADPSWRVGM
jgi:hypothetical protein